MRKFIMAVIIIVIFSLFPVMSLRADVLATPMDNDFYNKHAEECAGDGRNYYVNGRQGYVTLQTAPGAAKTVMSVENGTVAYLSVTYKQGGTEWALVMLISYDIPYDKWPSGWVPKDQMVLKYDVTSFDNDHKADLYQYTGDFDTVNTAGKYIVWSWPGSGQIIESFVISNPSNEISFVYNAYDDADGRVWGEWAKGWICLSDPANDNIPAFNPPPVPSLYPTKAQGGSWLNMTNIVIVMVIAVVIGTAVLIQVFWKPRNR